MKLPDTATKNPPVKSLPEAIRSSFMESAFWTGFALILPVGLTTAATMAFGAPLGVSATGFGALMGCAASAVVGVFTLTDGNKRELGTFEWQGTNNFFTGELSKEDELKWKMRGVSAALAVTLMGGAAGYSFLPPSDTASPPLDEPVITTPYLLEASATSIPKLTAPAAVNQAGNLGGFFQSITAGQGYGPAPGKIFAVPTGSGPALNGYASSAHMALA